MTYKGSNEDISDLIKADGGEWALGKKEFLSEASFDILSDVYESLYRFGKRREFTDQDSNNKRALGDLITKFR